MKIKALISTALIATFLLTQAASASFTDVKQGDPNYRGISYLELQGVVDSGTKFRPDDKVNKAEFFKILFELFGEDGTDVNPSKTFDDVPQTAWFAPFVELSIRYDLISTSSPAFNPEKNLNRADVLKYLFRVYGVAAPIVHKDERETLFNDIGPNHPKYAFINRAIELGIIEENLNKRFRPYAAITRGELAELLFGFDQWIISQPSNISAEVTGIPKPEILADVWTRIVERFYLDEDMEIDEDALFQSAVKGLIQSLNDPYSVYIPPASSDEFIEALSGEFSGIGTYLIQDEATRKIYITEFVPGSHAKELGLLVGDEVSEVDGIPVVQMSMEEATRRIRGEAGTTVELTIRRNEQSFKVLVERRALTLQNEYGEVTDDDLWLVDINSITSTSFIDVNQIFVSLHAKLPEPRAIVLDLRGNGGGYMDSAISIAGHFVPNSKPVVQLDYRDFVTTTYNSGKGEYADIPLYILVDKYTASASEILAAALREQSGAKLVGHTTFGKGTAQEITQYWDGSILKLTIAQWLTSEGATIQGIGLEPDIEVTQKSSTIDLWLHQVRQDLN